MTLTETTDLIEAHDGAPSQMASRDAGINASSYACP
jgi:hypothetical protein